MSLIEGAGLGPALVHRVICDGVVPSRIWEARGALMV
jgi:hypothetical protein